jgi:hypothetical protein
LDGLTIFLNPSDPVLSSALAFGIYENYETEIFPTFCEPGATVVDIGGNIGLYTAIAAARVGKARNWSRSNHTRKAIGAYKKRCSATRSAKSKAATSPQETAGAPALCLSQTKPRLIAVFLTTPAGEPRFSPI